MATPTEELAPKARRFPIPIRRADWEGTGGETGRPPLSSRLRGKRLYVAGQISCASSRVSISRYEDYILRHGAEPTESARNADIVLIDTCAYSAEREQASLDLIEHNESTAKPEAKLIVTGCLAGINPEKLRNRYRCEFFAPKDERELAYILHLDDNDAQFSALSDPRGRFMGTSSIAADDWKLLAMVRVAGVLHGIDRWVPLQSTPFIRHMLAASQAANPSAYALSISRGCLGNCSFCVIPMAKGRTTSVPMGTVVGLVKETVDKGTRRIILTSEDIGAYGKDIAADFADLLEKIVQIDGHFSLYLHFYDPRWLRSQHERLLPLLKTGKVKYLQLPLQSGNNRILNLMRRGYLVDHVLPLIHKIRNEVPGLSLGTQVIAGFPSETNEEHDDTKNLLKERLFDYVDVFPFSNRSGAPAEKLPHHLPGNVVQARANDLRKTWRRSRYLLP